MESGTRSVESQTVNFPASSLRSASQREASIRITASPKKPAQKRTSPTASPEKPVKKKRTSPLAFVAASRNRYDRNIAQKRQRFTRKPRRRVKRRHQRESRYYTWTRLQLFTSLFIPHPRPRRAPIMLSHAFLFNKNRILFVYASQREIQDSACPRLLLDHLHSSSLLMSHWRSLSTGVRRSALG